MVGRTSAEIIKKLNTDFAKIWFGWKKDGMVAEDLGDISYEVTYNRSTVEYYQSIYQTVGSRRSLTAVPFTGVQSKMSRPLSTTFTPH